MATKKSSRHSQHQPIAEDQDNLTMQKGHSPWAHAKILTELNKDTFVGENKPFKTEQEFYQANLAFLTTHNTYVNRSGRVYTCDEITGGYNGPLKFKGETLNIPKGMQFDDSEKCKITNLVIRRSATTPPPPPAPEQPALAEGRPLAQFEPSPDGAVGNAVGLQTFMYFYGKQPRDAAADRSQEDARVSGQALQPNQSEGKKIQVTKRDVADGVATEGERGKLFMARAGKGSRGDHGESVMKPSVLVHLDRDGNAGATNRRFPFKQEQNPRFVLDANNTLQVVVDGSMTISDARRNDPFHAGFITDHTTASNIINQWNNTGEGQLVLTQYLGLQEQYPLLAKKFLQGTGPASAVDAEKLLQWNAQLAMHPISWSVDSRGVPATDIRVVQKASQDVLESAAFKSLPEAEQKRLRDTYTPQIALYDNPIALRNSLGDVGKMYLPLDEKIPERAGDKKIRDAYYDTFGREKGHKYGDDERLALASEAGHVMSRKAFLASMTGPTEQALRLGTGLAIDATRQSADALSAGQSQWLNKFQTDPKFGEDVANYVGNNPAALQNWTDMLFHSTRNTGANSKILGFKTDGQADRFAADVSELMGGKEYRGKLDYHGNFFGKILNDTVLLPARVVVGAVDALGAKIPTVEVGRGINQRRGLDKDFTDTVKARLADTTTIEKNGRTPHDNTVEALKMIAERAEIARQQGNNVAATSLTLSLSPKLAEELDVNGKKSPLYQGIEAAVKRPDGSTIFEDQWVANGRRSGNVGAQVEQGTERKALSGTPVARTDDATLSAAIKQYRETGKGLSLPAGGIPAGQTGYLTGFSLRGANAEGATTLSANATANTPSKVSQSETNRETVLKVAAASPLIFSLQTLDMMAGRTGLDAQGLKNLDSYVQTVDAGGEGRGGYSGYADRMKHHAKAIAAAGDDPAKRNAAQIAAAQDLNGYFAGIDRASPEAKPRKGDGAFGKEKESLPGLAVSRLASQMAQDNAVSNEFDRMVGGQRAVAPAAPAAPAATNAKVAAPVQGAAISGKINDLDKSALQAALAGAATPEARAAAVAGWLSAHEAGKSPQGAGFALSGKLSGTQREAILAAVNAATPEARIAGITSAVNGLPAVAAPAAAPAAPLAGAALVGKMNAADRASLNAALAIPDGDKRVAALTAWLAGHTADGPAPEGRFTIVGKLSDEQRTDLVTAGGDTPAERLDSFNAGLGNVPPFKPQALVAGGAAPKVAGGPAESLVSKLSQPGTDVLAGLVAGGVISAQDRTQLLALQAFPDEASRVAGFSKWAGGYVAGENAKNANPGLSIVDTLKLAAITVGLTTGGGSDPGVIRGGVPECGPACVVPRVPTFPITPGGPGGLPIR